MAQVVRLTEDGELSFWCEGCCSPHFIYYNSPTFENWSWNGDKEKPTFSPSVFVNPPHSNYYIPHIPTCHSFVTNGSIQYLSDSTHHLSGMTVKLVDVSNGYGDLYKDD